MGSKKSDIAGSNSVKLLSTIFLVFFSLLASAQSVSFSNIPQDLQLYPRDGNDQATVTISGTVSGGSFDSIYVEVYREGSLWQRESTSGASGAFILQPTINAELANYSFDIYSKNGNSSSLIAERDDVVAGDVYLMTGQSNANYGYGIDTYSNEFCRSFGYMGNNQDYDPSDTTWGIATAEYDASDNGYYHVGSIALELQELILNTYGIPTCIINGASAGSEVEDHLRDAGNPEDLTTTYGRLLYRARRAGIDQNVRGIIWHQGENNCFSDKWQNYVTDFNSVYNSWKQDYPGFERIYSFQLRPQNCDVEMSHQRQIREFQRQLAATYEDVDMLANAGTGSFKNCHFWLTGYEQMAGWLFKLVARDIYNSSDTENITSPNLLQAYFTNGNQDQITLVFDQPMTWTSDSTIDGNVHSLRDYFYLDDQFGDIVSGAANGTLVTLNLAGTSSASTISYLPNTTYNGGEDEVYRGPWLRNIRGIGALSFFNVGVDANSNAPSVPTGLKVTR